ncbi:MAG TPA: S8 family serine peptidase [Actinomycetota bacterium]
MSVKPNGSTGGAGVPGEPILLSHQLGERTGRYIVVFGDEIRDDPSEIAGMLHSVAGVRDIASSLDFESAALDADQAASAEATVFAELGIAVVAADPEGAIGRAAAEDTRIVAVEPELIMYAIDEPTGASLDYVRGWRDAAAALYEQISSGSAVEARPAAPAYADNDEFTWGLQATMASTSPKTGGGTTVAVLDTGFDLHHPDFTGRSITAQSFVSGEAPQDGHGHGTHCVGTSCGPASPQGSRRYGVASGATILVGKVLSNQGQGADAGILAGINWAVANHAHVISMSLGANVPWVSTAYETAGRRALDAGSLIVAAAGNNAMRSIGFKGFVGRPANSPSFMAVAAIDSGLAIADFSARSNPLAQGGNVDIAGPGVAVYSSWPMPERYRIISGTSMATPHGAGIAALWHEVTGTTGRGLWSTLVGNARHLSLASADVGTGLAQAPQR